MSSLPLNDSANYENHPHSASIALRLLLAAQSFNQVYTPLLCLFGAVGNLLSVTVFCRASTHRSLSASFYLSALAISDIGYLLNLFTVWLDDMGLRVINLPVTCPLVMYLGQVTCFLSVWFIVAFTMERFFAVCYPLTRPTVCTVARAKKVIFGLTTVSLIGFSYVWVIARVFNPSEEETIGVTSTEPNFNESYSSSEKLPVLIVEPIVDEVYVVYNNNNNTNSSLTPMDSITVCSVRKAHLHFSSIANHIDSVLTLILPFGIISYLNVRIALCVWKLKDQRENLVAMAKITRQNSRQNGAGSSSGGSSGGGGRTHVGFVYRASKHHIHHRRQESVNHLHANGNSTPDNWKSKQNLTVEFEPSESVTSTTSTSVHCCAEFSLRNGKMKKTKSNNNQKRARKRRLNGSSHAAAETRVTKTLLLVSTVFLVLNLPSHVIRAISFIQSSLEFKIIEQEALFAAQWWSNVLFNMNFSVNFLLYCLSGKNFRMSLKNIFCNGKHHLARSTRRNRKSRSCSPNPYGKQSLTRSPSMTRYPNSVTEMESYA